MEWHSHHIVCIDAKVGNEIQLIGFLPIIGHLARNIQLINNSKNSFTSIKTIC